MDGGAGVEAVGVAGGFVGALVAILPETLGAIRGAVFGSHVLVFDDVRVLEAGIAAAYGPGGDEVAILFGCGCPALRFKQELFIPWNASDIETELVIFGAIGGGGFHVCVLLGWLIG